MHRSFIAAGVFLLAAACAKPQPPETGFEADFENDNKSWREIEAQMPAYPRGENLVPIPTGTATSHRFLIDPQSLALGEDGVMRYTVVAKAAGGAVNVSFEGIRCETRERKVYAIGHRDGTWVRARNAQWQRIVLRDLTPYSHTLYHQFFCNERTRPNPPRVALEALRRGRGLNPGAATDD
ncbi:MAG TPA: CNP1-like family protein [Burkholderiales bacterium]|nr:CNP1-like family protein [Burkholderiales bacterium]